MNKFKFKIKLKAAPLKHCIYLILCRYVFLCVCLWYVHLSTIFTHVEMEVHSVKVCSLLLPEGFWGHQAFWQTSLPMKSYLWISFLKINNAESGAKRRDKEILNKENINRKYHFCSVLGLHIWICIRFNQGESDLIYNRTLILLFSYYFGISTL